ncbi:Nucleobase-ascorbate transporter 4 [Camellia lanceoleosa]|uniref:Nucleobase-ascorbate transporter 4 n=1 Tax=Camellia lanceoleosa TaxID=1840588 RepID=A0ACC0IMN6_9ERIC|nr:Nucleobase-ascorbate transporter 4 [Camellia lanceoleosa]
MSSSFPNPFDGWGSNDGWRLVQRRAGEGWEWVWTMVGGEGPNPIDGWEWVWRKVGEGRECVRNWIWGPEGENGNGNGNGNGNWNGNGNGDGDGDGDMFGPHPVKEQLPGVDYSVAILLGFQHYVVMLGTTVIIPSSIVPQMGGGNREKAEVIQTLLFVSGVNTLLQTLFGTRLPVVIGASYTFVFPILSVVLADRYSVYVDPHDRFKRSMRGIQGALMIASILPILAGFLGVWRIFVRLQSPLSSVPQITLVGLGLYTHGFPQYIPHWFKTKGAKFERFFERYAVLLSIAIIWPYAALLTAAGAYKNRPPNTQFSCRVDRSGLLEGASWIRFPYPWQWGTPTVNATDAFIMMVAAINALVESTGTFKAASRYGGATPPHIHSRENVGLLAVTRVGSRRVIQISAVFMLFFSVFGKFGAILASIPLPIFGAMYCILFAYMSSAGLGLLQFCNLNSFRTKFIIGFSIFMGLSVPQYFNEYVVTSGRGPVRSSSAWRNKTMQVVFTSPATVAAITAVFLDRTVAHKHGSTQTDCGSTQTDCGSTQTDCGSTQTDSGWQWWIVVFLARTVAHEHGSTRTDSGSTRTDSGRHWWEKFRYFDKDPRSAEFYSLPGGLTKYFPSV